MPANQSFSRPATSSGMAGGRVGGDAYRRSSTSMMADMRPMTPKSGLMMQDRYSARITWNNRHTLNFIKERGDVSASYQERGLAALKGLSGEDGQAADLSSIQSKKEQMAGLQSAFYPFGANARTPFQKYVHKTSPYLAYRNLSDSTAANRRHNPDLLKEPGYADAQPWKGTSVTNQRYQYHINLSSVSLKMDADGSELEPVKSTGGSKTDSLIPGSSYSNANRFCPVPASLLLLKRAPHMSRGMTAPVTCAEYIDEARKDSKGETLRRERQLQAEHAKRLGIEDADQWLDGLAKTNASTDGGEEVGGNRLSGSDCHANLEVMPGGTSVRPNYKAMLDKNYLVRGERGYTEGRHYWEVTLTRFGVVGVGMHCIGVSSPGDPTEAGEQYCMGESRTAAAMMLGHCEKMRDGKTEAYGRRSVKQGDVIGVLIEMGLGEVSFFLNGVDLGVAYRGLRGPLYPAIEMGMMSWRDHYYDVRFNLSPPELKRPSTVSLPRPDTQTFAMMRDVLPSTSRKNNTQGFQSVKGPGSTGGGFGVGSAIKCYPQVGDYVLNGGRRPKTAGLEKLLPTSLLD